MLRLSGVAEEEGLEDAFAFIGGDAGAVVGNLDLQGGAGIPRGNDDAATAGEQLAE